MRCICIYYASFEKNDRTIFTCLQRTTQSQPSCEPMCAIKEEVFSENGTSLQDDH